MKALLKIIDWPKFEFGTCLAVIAICSGFVGFGINKVVTAQSHDEGSAGIILVLIFTIILLIFLAVVWNMVFPSEED